MTDYTPREVSSKDLAVLKAADIAGMDYAKVIVCEKNFALVSAVGGAGTTDFLNWRETWYFNGDVWQIRELMKPPVDPSEA